jgi:hypothetical protein
LDCLRLALAIAFGIDKSVGFPPYRCLGQPLVLRLSHHVKYHLIKARQANNANFFKHISHMARLLCMGLFCEFSDGAALGARAYVR